MSIPSAFLLAAFTWLPANPVEPPRPESVEWLAENAVPLTTCEPGDDLTELEAFGAMVGEARIVGLGEVTHGSHQVFRMKHRLFRYLVEKKGFTLFSLEANLPEAFRLNEYVIDGKGDSRQLLEGLYFFTWQTEEILALIEWMRDWNAKRGDREPVRFTGMDMQVAEVAATSAAEFITAHAEDLAERAEILVRAKGLRRGADPKTAEALVVELDALHSALVERREALAKASSDFDAEFAIRNVRIVAWATRMLAAGNGGTEVREEGMAENVAWILDRYPNQKIVLWAHNGHVGRAPLFDIRWMGSHLEQRYPGEMVVVGTAIGSGVYTAMSMADRKVHSDHPLLAPPEDSVEAYFLASELSRAIVDLRVACEGEIGRSLFAVSRPMRSIGGVATEEQFYPCVPREMFDVLVWQAETTASVPLAR